MSALSNYAENAVANALLRHTALDVTSVYIGLHTGDPGETGASAEITALGGYARQLCAFDAPTDGVCPNTAAETFGAATESWGTISHVSGWDALSGGNCLFKGALTTPRAVGNGDSLQFAIGALTVGIA